MLEIFSSKKGDISIIPDEGNSIIHDESNSIIHDEGNSIIHDGTLIKIP